MPTCSACGRDNPEGARFCNACGAPLAAAPEPRREERKVVSVLFADLVGFTSRAERLDPEDVRALLDPYWQRLRAELERFGGTVEKFIGDAVMALFGAPAAHEDDPERAVRAALAIRDWVRESSDDLQVRIAVATGEALVTVGARPAEGEGMAAGDVVNTAARLQSAAPVNGVLVGESTYRATRNVIEYVAAEPVVAKGKAEPLAVWEAVEARSRATIETVSAGPLVGRADELELLVTALQRARRDRGTQLVTVAGVPGIGKTRLVAELYAVVDADEEIIAWRRGRCLPYGDGVSLWALGEIVKAEVGVLASDSAAETEAKLAATLADLVADAAERGWLARELAPLAGLHGEPGDRAESFAAWRRFIEMLADRRPLILVVEDVQWADDELLDFVDTLVDRVAGVPLLVVCTTRPELFERRPGWGGGKRNALTVSLGPLADADTARIVARALEQAVLPAETQSAVLARAGGNPLYAEQYARMVAEGASIGELPETVQGIVAARLDLLPPEEKTLLQDAAVSGRSFWPGTLGIAAADERLYALERKEFIRRELRSSIAGEQEYSFAHALVRDVAYGQIPRAARVEKHRLAAEWLETLPTDRAGDRAAARAHHYGSAVELGRAAGLDVSMLVGPAARAFADAGDRAQALDVMPEAVAFYSAALALTPDDAPGRAQLFLERSRASLSVGGESLADAERAVALFEAAGDTHHAAAAELAAARAAWLAGRGADTERHADRALALTESSDGTPLRAEAVVERARYLMLGGEMARADEMATRGLALSEMLGIDRLQASALVTRGAAREGDPAEADLLRGIEIAERSKSVYEQLRGLNNLAEFRHQMGDLGAVDELYERMRKETTDLGLTVQLHWVNGEDVAIQYQRGNWDRSLELGAPIIEEEDAGRSHYLSPQALAARSRIRDARELPGGAEDIERAMEAARRGADPQLVAPILATGARRLALKGRKLEAQRLLAEVSAACAGGTGAYAWDPPVLLAFTELDACDEYRQLLADAPQGTWRDAAQAVCDRDYDRAVELYERIGALTQAAETRLLAAADRRDRGDLPRAEEQIRLAAGFFESVGASARLRELESLLSATG